LGSSTKARPPGAGIITGIGVVHGREVDDHRNDATVKGGTYFSDDRQKSICALKKSPAKTTCRAFISSIQGAAFLPMQAEVSRIASTLAGFFLQPSVAFGDGDRPDRGCHGFLHGRRRLCARDVRRNRDRSKTKGRFF